MAALKKSNIVEVDVIGMRMRRSPKNPLPKNDAVYQRIMKMRTVHVSGFAGTETVKEIQEYFEGHGEVSGLKIQRYKGDKYHKSVHKGACFITFSKIEECEKFLRLKDASYKGLELSKISSDGYYEMINKKCAQENKTQKEETENVTFLYVNGLSDKTITYTDIKLIFEDSDAPSFKYFYKFGSKHGTDGYAVMSTKDEADKALEAIKSKNGDKITVRNATEVTIAAMPENMLEKAQKSFAQNHYLKSLNKSCSEKGAKSKRTDNKFGGKKNFNKRKKLKRSHKASKGDNGESPNCNKKLKLESSEAKVVLHHQY